MSADSVLLRADRLARRHPDGRQWLLRDASLEISPAARIAVVGPSGSGKTLLLRALALLDPLDGGEVLWRGRPVRREVTPPFRREVVYLHQRPALGDQTVEATLRAPFALAVHRSRAFDRNRIVGLLDQLGRDESFLAKPTADLSGGETQVAALLRAIQLDPVVLLLDEPTAALDRHTTRAVEELLRRWADTPTQQRALVWVTHDPHQAQNVATTVKTMTNGTFDHGTGGCA